MSLQTVVADMKGRVETLTAQGQKAAQISLDTLKQANIVVLGGFQTLVKDQTTVAKDIYASAKSALEKAKADGFKAVASKPVDYLPPKDKLLDAFASTRTLAVKTGDELYKTVKTGFGAVQSEFSGEVAKVQKKAKTATRSATRKVKKATATVKSDA
jgi:hypothetical protein